MPDGSDVIDVLRCYERNNRGDSSYIEIQKRIRGVEIGVGRYFNGTDWVGPIEMNVEHKSLFPNGLGPKTDEMGTLMWYDDRIEDNKIYRATLSKMKGYLAQIGFRGDIDINCIVNESAVHPLEITARFGSPATQLQSAIHVSPWGEFLKAIADGRHYELDYRRGFGIVVLVAAPPFPYTAISKRYSMQGARVQFKRELTMEEVDRVHFEDVCRATDGHYYITGRSGYVLHVSGVGPSVADAQKNAYALIDQIVIPKKYCRLDIGKRFSEIEMDQLKGWGLCATVRL
jgi:phosphoribosylamine--glycine ligase